MIGPGLPMEDFKMRVWLDDIKPAPDGWIRVKTAAEAISLLENYEVDEISLDNDLGENQPEGYFVAEYIEERVLNNNLTPPKIHIHTAKPINRKRMEQIIKNIKRMEIIWNGKS